MFRKVKKLSNDTPRVDGCCLYERSGQRGQPYFIRTDAKRSDFGLNGPHNLPINVPSASTPPEVERKNQTLRIVSRGEFRADCVPKGRVQVGKSLGKTLANAETGNTLSLAKADKYRTKTNQNW